MAMFDPVDPVVGEWTGVRPHPPLRRGELIRFLREAGHPSTVRQHGWTARPGAARRAWAGALTRRDARERRAA
jgi:hypothetical protein